MKGGRREGVREEERKGGWKEERRKEGRGREGGARRGREEWKKRRIEGRRERNKGGGKKGEWLDGWEEGGREGDNKDVSGALVPCPPRCIPLIVYAELTLTAAYTASPPDLLPYGVATGLAP